MEILIQAVMENLTALGIEEMPTDPLFDLFRGELRIRLDSAKGFTPLGSDGMRILDLLVELAARRELQKRGVLQPGEWQLPNE